MLVERNGVKVDIPVDVFLKLEKEESPEYKFTKEKNEFIKIIENDINSTSDIVRKMVLKEYLKNPLNNTEDLKHLIWLYNDGKLRTNEEVSMQKYYSSTENSRNNYNNERHSRNIAYFLIPFTVTLIVSCIIFNDVMLFPIALIFALIAAFVGQIIGYNRNIRKAREYCIPDDDPRVIDEKKKFKVGIASGVVSAGVIGHHIKKGVKDITNVDSWEEMK